MKINESMFAACGDSVLGQTVGPGTVATCRVPNDPQQRVWSLERAAPDRWLVVFASKSLDKPRVELPLAAAQPVISGAHISLEFTSANGGRKIAWSIDNGPSRLDLFVNHGLEVNVERDLDPAVDSMNTDGPIDRDLLDRKRPQHDRPNDRRTIAVEWVIPPARHAA